MKKKLIRFWKLLFYKKLRVTEEVICNDPYVTKYENTSNDDVTAILFGYNDNFGQTNFGNPDCVVVTNLVGGSYQRLLAQSQSKEFRVGRWRFQSSNPEQMCVNLEINHVDANGKHYTTPFHLLNQRDSLNPVRDVLDSNKRLTTDGNTFVRFTLYAKTSFTICVYPIIENTTEDVPRLWYRPFWLMSKRIDKILSLVNKMNRFERKVKDLEIELDRVKRESASNENRLINSISAQVITNLKVNL